MGSGAGIPVKAGMPWFAILSIVSSLIYGVSPIDLIPDLIPLLGWVDDAVLVPLLFGIGIMILLKRRKAGMVQPTTAHPVIDVDAKPKIPTEY